MQRTFKKIKIVLIPLIVAVSLVAVLLLFQPVLLPFWSTLLIIALVGASSITMIVRGVATLGIGKKPKVTKQTNGIGLILLGACALLISAPIAGVAIGWDIKPALEITLAAKQLAGGINQLPGATEYCSSTGNSLGGSYNMKFFMVNETNDAPKVIVTLFNQQKYTPVSQETTRSETKNTVYDSTDSYDDTISAESVTIYGGSQKAQDIAFAAVYTAGSKITPYCGSSRQVTVPQGKMLIELQVSKTYDTGMTF